MPAQSGTCGPSARRLVLAALTACVCARRAPVRVGDVTMWLLRAEGPDGETSGMSGTGDGGARPAEGAPLTSRDVMRALDSLARTGHATICAMSFGIRSGGRRLYVPVGWEAPAEGACVPGPLIATVERALRDHAQWRDGASFSARDMAAYLADAALGARASRATPPAAWQEVYHSLRNLERRKAPLVTRVTDARRRVSWRRSAAAPEAPEAAVAPPASDAEVARLGTLVESEIARFGCHAVEAEALIASVCDGAARERLRRALRAAADRVGRRRRADRRRRGRDVAPGWAAEAAGEPTRGDQTRVDQTLATVVPLAWLGGRLLVTTNRWEREGHADVHARRAIRLVDAAHHTLAGRAVGARAVGPAGPAGCAGVGPRSHPGDPIRALCSRLDARSWAARLAAVDASLRAAEARARAGSPWNARLAEARTALATLQRVAATHAGAAPAPRPSRERLLRPLAPSDGAGRADVLHWVDAEWLAAVLRILLGPRAPGSVALRRALTASPVWRAWWGPSDRSAAEAHAEAQPHGGTRRGAPEGEHRGPGGAGRERVRWDRVDALAWAAAIWGGPRTRRVARQVRRVVGAARPPASDLMALLRADVKAPRGRPNRRQAPADASSRLAAQGYCAMLGLWRTDGPSPAARGTASGLPEPGSHAARGDSTDDWCRATATTCAWACGADHRTSAPPLATGRPPWRA